MVYLSRRYQFSASHRLYNDGLTAEENARIYGKCANPYGHGHNYVLVVTLAGPVDPITGMICDLAALDEFMNREVVDRFDDTHLNTHGELFRARVPTTENFCRVIFELLKQRLSFGSRFSRTELRRLRVEETSSNFFECEEAEQGSAKGK